MNKTRLKGKTMSATIRKQKNKYGVTYDYSKCTEWSMTKEESDAIFAKAHECKMQGDEEGYYNWIKKLPLLPNIALRKRDEMGKEALLAEGLNLADAEIVYGKDWLDNYMVD